MTTTPHRVLPALAAAATLLAAPALASADDGTALSVDSATDVQVGGNQASVETSTSASTTLNAAAVNEHDADDPGLVWPSDWAAVSKAFGAKLEGADIMGPTGDQVGEIEAVLTNAQNRVVAFGVETDNFLDIGDEEVIMPLDRLKLGADGQVFVTAMTEDQIETLPAWDD